MLVPKPNLESFAILIDSFSSSAVIIGATGPNTSSYAMRIFGETSLRTVGL
jgi:hypothetical protein